MKKALTIGELLVTMAIIGIIAMLVLPGFLKDYHKKLYVSHLKKVYEMIDTAVNQACIDNNVSYFYQTSYGQYVTGGGNQQAFIDRYFKKAAGTATNPFTSSYALLNGKNASSPSNLGNGGWAKLAGGEAIHFFCSWDTRCVFRVDLNATDGPNIMGRDFFTIPLDIYTNKLGDKYNKAGDKYDPAGCTTAEFGYGCLERILQDSWEMKY